MAISDSELVVTVRAVIGELQAAMAQAASAVATAAGQMQVSSGNMAAGVGASHEKVQEHVAKSAAAHHSFYERVSLSLSGVQSSLRAYGEAAAVAFAVLAGERAFANIIRSTQEWAFEVEHLAKLLGVSTEQASIYAVAAKEAGIGTEAFDRVARGLIKTLSTKPEAFKNIGVDADKLKTLPDLLAATLTRVDYYKEGINRLAAAQSVFGGKVQPETLEALQRWLAALPHATEVAAAFGVVLSGEGVSSARAYQRATADLELVSLGFKEVLATALRPELEGVIATITQLAKDGTLKQWADESVSGVKTVAGDTAALAKLLINQADLIKAAAAAWLAYRAALVSIEIVTATAAAFTTLATAVRGLQAAAAVGAALNSLGLAMGIAAGEAGFLAGAMTILTGGLNLIIPLIAAGTAGLVTYEGWWHKVGAAIRSVFTLITSGPTAAFADLNRAATAGAGFRPLAAHGESPESAAAGLKSDAEGSALFGGTAAQRAKAAKAAYDDLKSRQDADLKFFEKNEQAKLEVVRAYSAAIAKIRGLAPEHAREQATKELEQEQRAANQERQLSDLTIEHDVKNQIRRLDEEGKVLETKRRLGLLSVDELLAQETELENRRSAIVAGGIRARLALIDPQRDPVAYKRVSVEIEDAEAEHQKRLTDLTRKADAERAKAESDTQKHLERAFNDIGGAFDTAVGAVVDHNQKASEVIRSIWQSLAKDILKMIGEIIAKQAVVKLTGLPGKPGQGASSLLAEALTGGGGLFGGGKAGGADAARVAAETATQAKLTAATQHGLLVRLGLTAAHYVKLGALSAVHYAKEIALGVFALAKWIANQGIKLAIHIATETAITAVSIVESAARHAAEIAGVIKSIIAYAYKAASGAASAVASIPYAGPILAVANYAAILATVLGGVSSVSAAGGMEDTGPSALVTLLHPREMVLPAAIAESVRRGATAGTPAPGGEVHHHHHAITIHAVDAHSFERLLRSKPHVIADIAARGVSARPARGRHP